MEARFVEKMPRALDLEGKLIEKIPGALDLEGKLIEKIDVRSTAADPFKGFHGYLSLQLNDWCR